MSIVIHGVDAPETCNGCFMNLSGHCLANKGLYVGQENLEYNSKPDWCLVSKCKYCPGDSVSDPERERILRVLKTERECVSRDCDRDCGRCDLVLQHSEILSVYDTIIALFADSEDK